MVRPPARSAQLPLHPGAPPMTMTIGGAPAEGTRDYRSPLWASVAVHDAAVWRLHEFASAIRALPRPVLHAMHGTERRLLEAFLLAHEAPASGGNPARAGASAALEWLGFASRIEAGLCVYPTPSVIYRLRDEDGIVHFYCAPSRDAALAEHLGRLAPLGGIAATSDFLARPSARIEVEHPAGRFPGAHAPGGVHATFADVALDWQHTRGFERSRYVTSLPLSA